MAMRLTFEKTLAGYLLIAAVLALLLPSPIAVENHLPVSPELVPFANWLRRTPNALPFLTTYFLLLTALLPLIVALLARNPQSAQQFNYRVPSLGRCLGATLVAAAILVLLAVGMYGDISIDGSRSNYGEALAYVAAVSRIGLAIVGPLLMGTLAIGIYAAFVKLPRMWWGLKAGAFG